MRDNEPRSSGATYTSVDLNATGTTTVYDPTQDAYVYGAYLSNDGSSAVAVLEATDGSSTANVTVGQTAGDDIDHGDTVEANGAQLLQVNVTTAEGSDLSDTAVVFHSET